MDQFPPALPHGRLEQIFPDIFFVTGAMKRRHIGSTGKIEICVLIFRGSCHCYHPSTAAILGSTKVVTWWNSPKKSFQNGPVARRGKNQGYPAYTSR
jgi:hypothetical protein